MQKLLYLKYFFYLAHNWNIKIAAYILYHEIKGEKKYNIQTTGVDELKSLDKKGIDISHATIYMPVSYPVIEAALNISGSISEAGKSNTNDGNRPTNA